MKVAGLIIFGSLAVVGTAGYIYYKKQVEQLQEMNFELINFNVGDITKDPTKAFLTIRIISNSTIDATIKDLFIDVMVNGTKLGTIEETKEFIIPAKGYSDVPLTITYSPKLLLGSALQVLNSYLSAKDFMINLDGFVKIKIAFLSKTVPFRFGTSTKQLLST